ncbi:hypothetical protein, partial [Paraburkholderia caribensis]|uniref:hypothetical protein n=1 Tax=Paraburkholderia caribensis TaxID=75105 RepID=UPI0034D2F1BF
MVLVLVCFWFASGLLLFGSFRVETLLQLLLLLVWFWFAWLCAGIRELLAHFTRRPCAGRHLLFFAAAKKSRQKKAAHTASASSCLRAP